MKTSAAAIIFSNLNNSTLCELTSDRTVAAIPFACRYRLVDIPLSNLVNANISRVHIVANYNYRSLMEHIGSGKDWDLARRTGGIHLVSPYQTSRTPNADLYAYHMEALVNMKVLIDELKEDHVILADCDPLFTLDMKKVIAQHEKSGSDVTFVTAKITETFESKHSRLMLSSVQGKVTAIEKSTRYKDPYTDLSLNLFVVRTAYLRKVIKDAIDLGINSFSRYLVQFYKNANYGVYRHTGYVASVSSFMDYYRASIDMATNEKARESLLMNRGAPIFTKVHNSAPTIYKSGAKVQSSLIADDCVIEGTVINSVISRRVHIAKGAVVKNSVLYPGTYVGNNASLNCVVTDKDVHISDSVNISGNENLPIYIEKERKV